MRSRPSDDDEIRIRPGAHAQGGRRAAARRRALRGRCRARRRAARGDAALAARACPLQHPRSRPRARHAGRAAGADRRRRGRPRAAADARRDARARRSRFRSIRSWPRMSCGMSATPSPSWSPTAWPRQRTPPRRSSVDWQPLPHVIGAMAALAPGAPQVWPDRPGNLAFETELGDARGHQGGFRAGGARRSRSPSSISGW